MTDFMELWLIEIPIVAIVLFFFFAGLSFLIVMSIDTIKIVRKLVFSRRLSRIATNTKLSHEEREYIIKELERQFELTQRLI